VCVVVFSLFFFFLLTHVSFTVLSIFVGKAYPFYSLIEVLKPVEEKVVFSHQQRLSVSRGEWRWHGKRGNRPVHPKFVGGDVDAVAAANDVPAAAVKPSLLSDPMELAAAGKSWTRSMQQLWPQPPLWCRWRWMASTPTLAMWRRCVRAAA